MEEKNCYWVHRIKRRIILDVDTNTKIKVKLAVMHKSLKCWLKSPQQSTFTSIKHPWVDDLGGFHLALAFEGCFSNVSQNWLEPFEKADQVATLQPKEGSVQYITDLVPYTITTIQGKVLNDLGSALIRSTGKFSFKGNLSYLFFKFPLLGLFSEISDNIQNLNNGFEKAVSTDMMAKGTEYGKYGPGGIMGGIIGAIRQELSQGFRWFLDTAQDAFILFTVGIIAAMIALWFINGLWTLCTDRAFGRLSRMATYIYRWVRFRLHITGKFF